MAAGFWSPVLRNFLGVAIFSTHGRLLSKVVCCVEYAVMTDLQTKVEKYESKVAQCEEWVTAGEGRTPAGLL